MKQFLGKVGSLCAISVVALTLAAVPLHAQVNAVYVQVNDVTANTVVGYSIDTAGNLTPLAGSPWGTGGTGWPGPTALQQDDDGQVITNPAGTLLYTVNGHSNTIAGYSISSSGSLTPTGPVVNSAGSQPASVALFDKVLTGGKGLLSVINKSSDTSHSQVAPNLVSFTVGTDGVLTPNKASKVVFPTGDSPSQVIALKQAHLAFVDEFMGGPSKIDSYRIHANGTYTLINSVPVGAGQNVFLGMALNPAADYLYAALPVDNFISVLSFNRTTGMLAHVTDIPTSGLLACWLGINATGTRLYSGDTMSRTVTVYDTSLPSAPIEIQHFTLSTVNDSSPSPWNVGLDPTGKFLYVVSNKTLHVLNVASDGTLTETVAPTILTLSTTAHPYGLATVLR